VHVAPNIDEKRLNNAIKSFSYVGQPDGIVALFDNTLFGSAKEGLLFTGERVIYKQVFSDPISIGYSSIAKVEHVEKPVGDKGKLDVSVVVTLKNGDRVVLKDLLGCKYDQLTNLLDSVFSGFSEFKEERQLIPLAEMSEPLKVAYIKAVINMAFDNDGVVDEKELAEILLLMTRIRLSPDSRFALRSYMATPGPGASLGDLMHLMNTECPSGQERPLHLSLVKDLLNVYFSTGGSDPEQFAFLQKHRGLLLVGDEEIELAVMAIRNDHAMLKDDFTDDKMIAAVKLMSAKAAAIGTPLAAVYLSGSVVGLSAAGMTSGLAALGMGGVLGMSSMATGIGVAVLLGVGVYAGVRKLTGANELGQSKRRELMLNEIIKQTQLTISLLIQDINFITARLNSLIESAGAQDSQIRKLMALMQQLSTTGTVLTDRAQAAQQGSARLRCAQFLDERKLKLLTKEPTKASLKDHIASFYEPREFQSEVDGKTTKVTKLAIRKDKTAEELESLAGSFALIGYFDVSEVIMGNAADIAERAKSSLAGLFK